MVEETEPEVVHDGGDLPRSEVTRKGWSPERRIRQAETMRKRWAEKTAARRARDRGGGVSKIGKPSPVSEPTARGPGRRTAAPALESPPVGADGFEPLQVAFDSIMDELHSIDGKLRPWGLRLVITDGGSPKE